jgi:hypothetical protein
MMNQCVALRSREEAGLASWLQDHRSAVGR